MSSSGRRIITRADKRAYSYARSTLDGTPVSLDKDIDLAAALALSPRQARILVDAWAEFDGTTGRTRRVRMARAAHADAFEVLAVHAGYALTPRSVRRSDIGDVFELTLSKKRRVRVRRETPTRPGLRIGEPTPEGTVWCVTVPSHTIVVRRRGLTLVTGQCAEALAIRQAFPRQAAGIYVDEEMAQADAAARDAERAEGDRLRAEQRQALVRPFAEPATMAETADGEVVEGVVVPTREELLEELAGQAKALRTTTGALASRAVAARRKNVEDFTPDELLVLVESRRVEVAAAVAAAVTDVAATTVVPETPEDEPTLVDVEPVVAKRARPPRKATDALTDDPAAVAADHAHEYVDADGACLICGDTEGDPRHH